MAASGDPPETSSDRRTLMAKARSKAKTFANHKAPGQQENVNIVLEDIAHPDLDESEKGRNRLRMEQVQVDLKIARNLSPTELEGGLFIFATKPLPSHNTTTASELVQTLRRWRNKELGPDNITYLSTKNKGWVTKDDATKPVIGIMKGIMNHHPEPLSRVSFRWMQQLYTSCVLAALPDPHRSGALALPRLTWAAAQDAVIVKLDITASSTSVAVNDEKWEHSPPLEMWIPKHVAGDCAELEIDPVFQIEEAQEVQRKATAAQRGFAKFLLQKCARNVMNQGEAMILGQRLVNQYGKKRENNHTGPFRIENMVLRADLQSYMPSWPVQQACPELPNIYVGRHTSETDWKFHLAQAAHVRFAETGSVEDAWQAACETADLLLDFGQELFYLPCFEAETEKSHTLHACYGCWFVCPCVELTLVTNRRYCQTCINAIPRAEHTSTEPSIASDSTADTEEGRDKTLDILSEATAALEQRMALQPQIAKKISDLVESAMSAKDDEASEGLRDSWDSIRADLRNVRAALHSLEIRLDNYKQSMKTSHDSQKRDMMAILELLKQGLMDIVGEP